MLPCKNSLLLILAHSTETLLLESLPLYVKPVFILTVLLAMYLFYRATNRSNTVLILMLSWVAMQGIISFTGFYEVMDIIPPRPLLLILVPLVAILIMFLLKDGRAFTDRLEMKWLTLLHFVRAPAALIVYWLYLAGGVPKMLTFTGGNYDVFFGLSAPFVYHGFIQNRLGRKFMLWWNIAGLILLLTMMAIAVFSIRSELQKLNFEQPITALLQFPFTWMRAVIVPMVLYSHLAAIRQLTRKK